MVGQMRLDVLGGDVRLRSPDHDVPPPRRRHGLRHREHRIGADYTGQLQVSTRLRITDAAGGGIATTLDSPLTATVPCTATSAILDSAPWLPLDTTVDEIIPGAVAAGVVSGLGMGRWRSSTVAPTATPRPPDTLFLTQGLFIP